MMPDNANKHSQTVGLFLLFVFTLQFLEPISVVTFEELHLSLTLDDFSIET